MAGQRAEKLEESAASYDWPEEEVANSIRRDGVQLVVILMHSCFDCFDAKPVRERSSTLSNPLRSFHVVRASLLRARPARTPDFSFSTIHASDLSTGAMEFVCDV